VAKIDGRFLGRGWYGEAPSGTINGSNKSFTISYTPTESDSLTVWVDGLTVHPTTHYTFAGTTISFVDAPAVGQTIYARYYKLTGE